MGDAFNWEWMIYCAARRKAELVIISRDTDYRVVLDEKCKRPVKTVFKS